MPALADLELRAGRYPRAGRARGVYAPAIENSPTPFGWEETRMNPPQEQATLPATPGTGAATTIKIFVGGRWVDSSAKTTGEVRNPANDELLARVPMGGAEDVGRAVQAALAAYPAWRATPPVNRVRPMFKFRELLEKHFDDVARIVTREHGKTLDESRSSVRRAVDNVELACGIPSLMQGMGLEDIATGIDSQYYRQPLGVFAAITPFNFPAMVPMWFLPHAVACGNTFIVKPSERVPLSQMRMFELLHEAGFPDGVVNLVHGAKEAVDFLLLVATAALEPGGEQYDESIQPDPQCFVKATQELANSTRFPGVAGIARTSITNMPTYWNGACDCRLW